MIRVVVRGKECGGGGVTGVGDELEKEAAWLEARVADVLRDCVAKD